MSSEVDARGESVNWERVLALSSRLSSSEKLRLIAHLADQLAARRSTEPESKAPKRSLLGAVSHLGRAPSEEEIAEARREMAKTFPREDICS